MPESVPRQVELPDALSEGLALVIQGVRRSGKSTLLQQLPGRYGIDLTHCAFVNFEDPRLIRALTFETLEELVRRFREIHPRAARLVFFLDEIQIVEGWQRWLRSKLDRPSGHLFVITGSNSQLLSGEFGSALTGRHLSVQLFPFDLDELRLFWPQASLEDYLQRGGFPEPLTLTPSDSDRLLGQYFLDIVERDVRERVGARSALPVRQIAQMAFESAGSELSLRRVAAATGVAVETTGRYLAACEDAQLLFNCPFFAFSERKRASMNRKYYPVDTGLRRVVVTRSGADRGKMIECATHLALRRRYGQVFYWRERGEVDFVVREGDDIIPVQVTWEAPEPRHHAALDAFYERFPMAREPLFINAESFEMFLGALTRGR